MDLLDVVQRYNENSLRRGHRSRPPISVRIGVHTGPVIAGILGDRKFCYDVWGDGVDGASSVEQGGEPNQVMRA